MNKTIYNYHPQTGEFISEVPADESPLEPGVVLLPAFATALKPPKTAAREVAVFANGQWQVKANWRGVTLFVTTTGAKATITEIGKTPTDIGATDISPPAPEYSWANGAWTVDQVKVAAKLAASKADGMARIDAYGKAQRVKIAGTPDEIEIAAWNNKLVIAKAIKTGTASAGDKAAFQAEINARGKGETVDAFADKVLVNASFYAQAVGLIDGLKRRTQDAVNAANTPEEVETVLAAMKSQAEAAFAQLMGAAK